MTLTKSPWDTTMHVVTYAWGGISADGHSEMSTCQMSGGFRLVHTAKRDDVAGGAWIIVAPSEDGPMASAWIKKSINGPMVDTRLAPGQVNRCDRQAMRESIIGQAFLHAWAAGEWNEFTNLTMLANVSEEFSGFDYVDPATYAALAALAGARIGRKEGQMIVWSDGSVLPLPAPDSPDMDYGYALLEEQQALVPHQLEGGRS